VRFLFIVTFLSVSLASAGTINNYPNEDKEEEEVVSIIELCKMRRKYPKITVSQLYEKIIKKRIKKLKDQAKEE